MRFGIVVFPGSNCDHDAYHVAKHVMGQEASFIWHKDTTLGGADAVILPGGFAYGDYLRAGAIARFSPAMEDVIAFARKGGPVLAICNGFQIACEAGLLPGALIRNQTLKFHSFDQYMRVENNDTMWTSVYEPGQILRMPVAHGEGNYFADPEAIRELEAQRQVIFRYTDAAGEATDAANPNGSINNIAGICNRARNVAGLMPHPERACEAALGSADGRAVLQSIVNHFAQRVVQHA